MTGRRVIAGLALAALALLSVAPVEPPDGGVALDQGACPVTGQPVQEGCFADYRGERVHFCCSSCAGEFAQHPETYLAMLPHKIVKLRAAPPASAPSSLLAARHAACAAATLRPVADRSNAVAGFCAADPISPLQARVRPAAWLVLAKQFNQDRAPPLQADDAAAGLGAARPPCVRG